MAIGPDQIGKTINPAFIKEANEVVAFNRQLTDPEGNNYKGIAQFWENGGGTAFPQGGWVTWKARNWGPPSAASSTTSSPTSGAERRPADRAQAIPRLMAHFLHVQLTQRSTDHPQLSTVNIHECINGHLGTSDRVHAAGKGLLPEVVIKHDDSLCT